MKQTPFVTKLAYIQSGIYLVTGLWPVFEIDSFMAVTGPKVDLWLVRTVGLLIATTGATLFVAAKRREISLSIVALACMNALFLAGIDIFYSMTGVISKVYLLDAGLELGLIVLWVFAIKSSRTTRLG